MDWKDFFYFSRRERQGIILLLVFIAGIFLGKWIFTPGKPQALEAAEWTKETYIPSGNVPKTPVQPDYVPLHTSRQQADRKSYSHAPKQEEKRTYYNQEKESAAPPKSAPYPQTEKFAAGTVIELNAADTLALMRIPGIGASFAKRITSYRNILGGYHRIEQLQEVYSMYEELYIKIIPYLEVNPQNISRIPVNTASLDKLKAHPYINFYQAKAIVELRKKKGTLTGIEDLQLLEEFSPDDWIRLAPYLAF